MTGDPLLLSPDGAAERLGVARTSVYQLVRSGRLRAVRPLSEGGELRFRASDLVAFVDALEAVDPSAVPERTAPEGPVRATLSVRSVRDGSPSVRSARSAR